MAIGVLESSLVEITSGIGIGEYEDLVERHALQGIIE